MTVEVFVLGNIVSVRFDDYYYCFSLGIVVLVIESGFPDFLCSSTSLTESVLNPTVFCLISGVIICCYCYDNSFHQIGAVFHYIFVGIYVFWTFHIGYFFYKVMFPFHSNAHQSYKKYIHLIMAIFGKKY